MVKQFLMAAVFLMTGSLCAQDLPPLPSDNSAAGGSAGALPPLPGQDNSAAGVPPLPGQGASTPSSSAGGLPPLPGQGASTTGGSASGLPPLPGQDNSAAAPLLPGQAASAPGDSAGGLPPLPGQETQSQAPAPPAPVAAAPSTSAPASTDLKNKGHVKNPYFVSKWRPNVIFGGWVHPKGGGAQIRIAWTSQEILNALYGKGYTILTEDGDYMADSWRQFTFNVPKSNLTLEVYLRQVGNKIWMRVGPSEPPAGVPLAKVEKIKAENLRALNTLRGKFRNRLTARLHGNWEAPYNRPKHTVGV